MSPFEQAYGAAYGVHFYDKDNKPAGWFLLPDGTVYATWHPRIAWAMARIAHSQRALGKAIACEFGEFGSPVPLTDK